MYRPKLFNIEDQQEITDFIKANGFGILITSIDDQVTGTHIPLHWTTDPNGDDILYGHIAIANPQCEDLRKIALENKSVLCIFNGPHAYISSSWYGHENVPTWNYIATHVYGTISLTSDDETLFALSKLMAKYEDHQTNPVRMEDLSKQTMRQVNGILAFKITPTEIQGKKKLSQNRNKEDYQSIIEHLDHSSNEDRILADEMRKIEK